MTDANGVTTGVPNEIGVAIALEEIYDKSQVSMIGEAISTPVLRYAVRAGS